MGRGIDHKHLVIPDPTSAKFHSRVRALATQGDATPSRAGGVAENVERHLFMLSARSARGRLLRLSVALSTSAARAVTIESLRTPALVCYRDVLEANAVAMRQRAVELGVALRPHFKTVKSLEAAAIATDGARRRITVSTLAEARFLAEGGWDDILYAVPLTPDKIEEVIELHTKLECLIVMVDHMDQVRALTSRGEELLGTAHRPLRVVVGVDCGYHRDGCDPDDPGSVSLVRELCESAATEFAGLYTHGGHSYDAASAEEIQNIGEAERDVTTGFAQKLRSLGLDVPSIGVGSTPTCSLPPTHLQGVDEIHPGCALQRPRSTLGLADGCGLCMPLTRRARPCLLLARRLPPQQFSVL